MKKIRKALNFVVVILCFLLAILGIILPIMPGLIFLAIGLIILSIEVPQIENYIHDKVKNYPKLESVYNKMKEKIDRIFKY